MTALFAVLVGAPFLLPLIADLGDLVFAVPLIVLSLASVRIAGTVRGRTCGQLAWAGLSASAGLTAVASGLALVAMVGGESGSVPFYVGSAASVALLVAVGDLARRNLSVARFDGVVEALLVALLVSAVGIYFVVIPGLARGDALLTAVFVVDLVALALALVSVFSRSEAAHRRVGWSIIAACAAIAAGDALVAAASAAVIASHPPLTALFWLLSGVGLLVAASHDAREGEPSAGGSRPISMVIRVGMPLVAVLSFPALVIVIGLTGGFSAWELVYFSGFFITALVLAFGRQAYLLVDNQRAVARERRLREQAVRRNEELEALTGLATTMTQTLEEDPIVESGLDVLRLAARASSSALHCASRDGLQLRAVTGEWHTERAWAGRPDVVPERPLVLTRGRRQILRIPLTARGAALGVLTLVRPEDDAFDAQELALLTLLAGQLGIAVQNARDYHDRLEQAIRDPLTGLYNRRFFYEALEQEIRRHERYATGGSLVVFDIDDFKSVNDSYGHAAGDEVLRAIGRIVTGVLRPSDTFARIGGEEFGVLLPETGQLDALLVAERIRTAVARHPILSERRVTISGGVSSCPGDGVSSADLARRADAALYWAKGNGKNLCAVASEVTGEEGHFEGTHTLAHLYGVVATIDSQDFHSGDHSENVASYSVALGQKLGLDRDHVVRLRRAGLLHDIGKVAVSARILEKPAALDDAEMSQMRLHAPVGGSMLEHAGLGDEAAWVRHHHERVDGSGYPDRLEGDAIPLEARIMFVADAFEAMTSDRPYRRGMPVDAALAELRRHAGTQFEPAIVDAMVELVDGGELTVLAVRAEDAPVARATVA